jgi:hypothetical protein
VSAVVPFAATSVGAGVAVLGEMAGFTRGVATVVATGTGGASCSKSAVNEDSGPAFGWGGDDGGVAAIRAGASGGEDRALGSGARSTCAVGTAATLGAGAATTAVAALEMGARILASAGPWSSAEGAIQEGAWGNSPKALRTHRVSSSSR